MFGIRRNDCRVLDVLNGGATTSWTKFVPSRLNMNLFINGLTLGRPSRSLHVSADEQRRPATRRLLANPSEPKSYNMARLANDYEIGSNLRRQRCARMRSLLSLNQAHGTSLYSLHGCIGCIVGRCMQCDADAGIGSVAREIRGILATFNAQLASRFAGCLSSGRRQPWPFILA